jgi:tetratricopeptide (TPR) repeat protein
MGDLKALLEIIEELKATRPSDPSVRELSEELEIEAKRGLRLLSRHETLEMVKDFITTFRNRQTHIGRAKAALSSVKLAISLCDMELFEQLQEALARLPIDMFEPREKATALIAEAMNAFHRRDTAASTHAAELAAEVLEKSGNQDATLASLKIGLGVVAMANGDYENAIQPFNSAISVATKLGNDDLISMAAQNLALTYFRMGDYRAQKTWATLARRHQSDSTFTFNRVITAALLGMASVLVGTKAEALVCLDLLQREIENCKATWVAQFGQYYAADMFWLLGRKEEALEMALEAGACSETPKNPALTGQYARWSALVSMKRGTEMKNLESLTTLWESRNRLDVLDRAELDCAVVYLGRHLGLATEQYEQDLNAALTDLPPSCGLHLAALGLLDHG